MLVEASQEAYRPGVVTYMHVGACPEVHRHKGAEWNRTCTSEPV